ncbi:hypothetical protein MWH28_08760 [Natroniella sulfidigena]|uniref:hypothetical protein n=1 Tax=Natroniella sulfidigena TaxID=723921 RepID=UPI00200A0700|nr:hypothetical protein [Natroniella sulfidigena]MCK8817448.1 hypothetical protein [Natroniella sulfidigena]
MRIRTIYLHLLVILLLMTVIVAGCEEAPAPIEEDNVEHGISGLEEPDLSLLAYQLELEIRSSFQSAYNSWINIDRLTERDEESFEQIISVLNYNLSNFVSEEEIEEYIEKLRDIDRGGEGEVAFPTHEVVEESEVIEQNNETVRVQLITTRYYPETEWGGEAYNRDFDYVVTLVNDTDSWMIQEVNYN